jgi:hypothetical protein
MDIQAERSAVVKLKTPASTGTDRGLDALEEEKNLSASW